MIVNDVLRRVQTNLGDNSGVMAVVADVIDAVNDSVLEIVREIEHPIAIQTINVVAGTFEYALDANFVLAKRVTYLGHRIKATTIEEVDAIDPDAYNTVTNVRGTPEWFYIEGFQIGLYPVPSETVIGALVLRYVQKPADIDDGADTVPLPVIYHPVVVRLIQAYYKERDEDYEAAAFVRGDAMGMLGKIVDQTLHATSDSYPIIREPSDRVYYE